MTLVIAMLNNISQHKTITSSIQMRYVECRNVHTFYFKKSFVLANSITFNGHGTLRSLGMYFWLFVNSVHDTKY